MAGKNYRDLVAWQLAMDLTVAVYEATAGYPVDERFGLVAQMRKAAVSIPSNIAEGQGRRSRGAFCQHLSIAHGSLRELETQLILSGRLRFLPDAPCQKHLARMSEVGRLITGLSMAVSGAVGE
jgi:four helix bundle protein